MKGKIFLHSVSATLLIFLTAACAGGFRVNQVQFGISAAQADLWEEAIFRWKKVISTEPNNASAHNNLAVAFEKKGMMKEAEIEYKVASELAPKNRYIQSNFDNFKKRAEVKEEENNEKK